MRSEQRVRPCIAVDTGHSGWRLHFQSDGHMALGDKHCCIDRRSVSSTDGNEVRVDRSL